ncbi:UDP-N-acetylmuramyl tripeptide synthase [Bifidobacterium goeldii]|uniref:Lipid II isoglutaminyl synthase (glutamine-hydrolyzing) subunit MurT n=1 Tax=Bifidobacterium goeldii TaxID=2306975 RepID=A0A430FDU2_9BIFI|nr:Mur ligase family protein [Bifidobacterium goeldii]RSX51010.1 UDP-N-acetylmuramyl tripeptide synthase [Bifidobacterium goeldii]
MAQDQTQDQTEAQQQNHDDSAAANTPAPKRPWNAFATPLVGKAVREASRLLHHGGSAFPGKIAEDIDPGFLARTLGQLPLGVVLVSGTNGKTTTTRMVASLMADLGLKVFTNPTGSNFTRGVVSALLEQVTLSGKLDADIAVLELDEAYAVHFVHQVRPRYALLLNVMRDQLDRFGEIDNTARLLGHVAEATDGTVVLNREDPRIAALASVTPAHTKVQYFGLADDLKHFFPSDDDMATTVAVEAAEDAGSAEPATAATQSSASPASAPQSTDTLPADVTLTRVGDHEASFLISGESQPRTTTVRLEGVYNLYNAAAALAVVRAVQADARAAAVAPAATARTGSLAARVSAFAEADADALLDAVSRVTPAFGRGETIEVNGSEIQLLLVKNPMGFRLSLGSFPPAGHETMIIINDEYADGRDMSWLWDVDFTSLRETGVAMVSGTRAWDMALRLEYDRVTVEQTGTDLESAVKQFATANPGVPKHIYCTYTAMLRTRAELAKLTHVADAGVGR